MPHMEGIFINGEKAKFHPEDILDTDASQYTEEIGESVTAYLTEHITNPSNPPIDTSLSIAGAAADAKETGDEISQLKSELNDVIDDVSIINGDVWSLGNGYIVSNDGVITTPSSSSFTLYGAIVEPNTKYTVYRHAPTFSTLNRIFVMFLNEVIYKKADFSNALVTGTPTIETSGTDSLKKDVVTSPNDAKMIVICVPSHNQFYLDGRSSIPTLLYKDKDGKTVIVPKNRDTMTLEDIGLNTNGSIQQDGSVLFDATNAQISTFLPNVYKTNNGDRNCIITLAVKTEGTTADKKPNIIIKFNRLYEEIPYNFDSNDYTEYELRMPFLGDNFEFYKIQIIIPVGTKLYIKKVSTHFSDYKKTYTTGVRLSAHLGVTTLTPENSAIGFLTAGKIGYPSAICNPKVTSDGGLVCIHDSTINRTARNPDGTSISGTVSVASNTYADLNEYDYGLYVDSIYAGTKLLKLEEFFRICALYGMAPVFSIHQSTNPLTSTEWAEIKKMLLMYGLTESLMIKCGDMTGLEVAYETMGDSVFAYTYDIGGTAVATAISSFDASPVHNTKARKYIGISKTYISDENVEAVIAAGYHCEMYDIYATQSYIYEHYMKKGVSEFVDDQNPSYGYKWMM